MSKILRYLFIILSLLVPVTSFISGGFANVAITLILISLFWILTEWQGWNWFASIWLLVIVGIAAYGVLVELSTSWMFLSALCALIVWDLTRLTTRLEIASPEDNPITLEISHIRGLFIFTITASIISIMTMNIQLRLSFGQALILMVITFAGIMQLIRWYRRNHHL